MFLYFLHLSAVAVSVVVPLGRMSTDLIQYEAYNYWFMILHSFFHLPDLLVHLSTYLETIEAFHLKRASFLMHFVILMCVSRIFPVHSSIPT